MVPGILIALRRTRVCSAAHWASQFTLQCWSLNLVPFRVQAKQRGAVVSCSGSRGEAAVGFALAYQPNGASGAIAFGPASLPVTGFH